MSDALIGEWKSNPRYRLHRSLVAVQLSTPNGVPILAELSVGKVVHLIGESTEPGSVQVVCDDGQTYQVFLEDLTRSRRTHRRSGNVTSAGSCNVDFLRV